MRPDLEIIRQWIKPGSSVLDLGCGDGTLLATLQDNANVTGYGLEIEPDNIVRCIENGVNVIQRNLDSGLSDFDDDMFDYVVMTQAIQTLSNPDLVLDEMLRIGKECVVTFPNFGYWRNRLYLLRQGKMPVTERLPYSWYDTPNIHFCTFKDFETLCNDKQLKVLTRTVVDHQHQTSIGMKLLPNLLGEIAIYQLGK
ncbi:methionine biosynthesis protein MetW [Pelagibaculum spongiae]|uniref:Methionine biosynthesis protein MetW n=1 Tax=Pelagibaculum spongiae TaxID=2080658 RepID=A0A2V1GYM6_9GAMM|nr:methionine biosynthesis protein MetW [Pelagibaculum spongiae]PVZ72181.1 methionine biosynthesis protein MetW [Pelagibaculum spongiae]